MYSYAAEQENLLQFSQFRLELMSGKRISYFHRLAPMMKLLANSCESLGFSRAIKTLSNLLKSVKNFKTKGTKFLLLGELL